MEAVGGYEDGHGAYPYAIATPYTDSNALTHTAGGYPYSSRSTRTI